MWASTGKEYTPFVRYGNKSDELNIFVNGTGETYDEDDMCGAEGEMDGYSYYVLLENLQPNTEYYYKFGNPDEG